ncbi:MAG: hypothetical protein QOH34_3945, partial [Mycobacterium sp.]|nr:hypothetical protein [Mycobacterium sp.]
PKSWLLAQQRHKTLLHEARNLAGGAACQREFSDDCEHVPAPGQARAGDAQGSCSPSGGMRESLIAQDAIQALAGKALRPASGATRMTPTPWRNSPTRWSTTIRTDAITAELSVELESAHTSSRKSARNPRIELITRGERRLVSDAKPTHCGAARGCAGRRAWICPSCQ